MNVSGGGFSKGQPINWPAGKPPPSKELNPANDVFPGHRDNGKDVASTSKTATPTELSRPLKDAQTYNKQEQLLRSKI